jgi:hypothetical protein
MWVQRIVKSYDAAYRAVHGLDRPAAQIPPVLRVELRRAWRRRTLTLADGTTIGCGDRIGLLHLDNGRLAAVHLAAPTAMAVGLEVRRAVLASLTTLAQRARPGGGLAGVVAFAAVTILHRSLPRIGFEPDPVRVAWPWLISAYQRALLASIHPDGSFRVSRLAGGSSERLWISRGTLLARYGEPSAQAS